MTGRSWRTTRARSRAPVQKDRSTQETRNTNASQPVNFFKTSAVDVPKSESDDSPPKDAPKPVVLLSWIKITKQSTAHKIINSMIEIIYSKPIVSHLILNNFCKRIHI